MLHFHHLASFGEQILLSIRFGDWTDLDKKAAHAANWARYWRSEIQGYIHAYRTVTGVDLSDTTDTTRHLRYLLPSTHLRNRLAGQRPAALPEGTPAALPAGRSSAMPAPTPRALSQGNRTTREW